MFDFRKESLITCPDGSTIVERNKNVCQYCAMKHYPHCRITLCRNCKCAKEWHPLNGRCRVGPETEFRIKNCFCSGYVPLDNLEYLEWCYNKNA